MTENERQVYSAGIVLGVLVEVKPQLDADGKDFNFYMQSPERRREALPFAPDFCAGGFFGSRYDINKPLEQGDLKILYQSGVRNFSKIETLPAVIGVRLLYNPFLEFRAIDDLLTNNAVKNVRARAREISKMLKELSLPSKPIRVYATGEYHQLLPDVKQG